MFFVPILMSLSALIALLIPSLNMTFLPTLDHMITSLKVIVEPDPWVSPVTSSAPLVSYETTGPTATARAADPSSPVAPPASTCATRAGLFIERSRLLEHIPFMEIIVEVVEEPRVHSSRKVHGEGWIEFIRSIVLRYLASSIVEEPWLFVDFYYALAPLVPDAADPILIDQAQTDTLVVSNLAGVDQAMIVSHLLRLWIFAWYIQSGDLGERRWIWVTDLEQMTMVVR